VADLSDFNPAFSPLLNAYTAALDKAGIRYRLDSGYRSPEQQAEIYARSQQGKLFPAAPPWRSFHNYGFAADVIPANPADYQRMWDYARQAGLASARQSSDFSYDKPHVEMPGQLADLVNQYNLANWRPASQPAPATGAIAYDAPVGRPSRIASRTPGVTLNTSPLDIVLNAESGDRNINNVHQMTSSGQAQGHAQITTGTWTDFAPAAGVDLKQYPTPDSAPRNIQIQVANTIPLNRWAKSTVNAVLAKYPGIDTSQTLGAIQSAALKGGPSGASTAVAGGPSPSGATPAPEPPKQALAGFQAGSPAEKSMLAAGKTLGLGADPKDYPEMPSAPQIPPPQAMGGMMMLGPGQQNTMGRAAAQQQLAQQGFMMGPSLAAFTPPQPQAPPPPPGSATGMPGMGLPGTTLNSPSQLQMALMSGALSPYDVYASGGFGGGGLGSA
jgi:hypothetical protein